MNNKTLLCTFLIMALSSTTNTFAADWLYTVRPGDTLWDLCQRFTNEPGCWHKLGKVNNVIYPRRLPLGFVINFPVGWLKTIPTPVEVSFVNGEVSVQHQQNANTQTVSVGDKLPIGTKIITREGHINLLFADGTTMQLESNSELILDTLSTVDGVGIVDSRLRLNQGAVKTRVINQKPASRFQITTPTAIAAVRGTRYRVSSITGEQSLMRGEVFEGIVDVNANKTQQSVTAGFGIIAKPGKPLTKPRPLLPSPTFTVNETAQVLPAYISWQPLENALAYQLDILNDNNSEQLLQKIQLSTSNYTINTLAMGCYRIRLRGIDNEQLQGLATVQKLCIAPTLAVPTLHTKNSNYDGNFVPTLNWLAIKGATHYRFQISRDASFNTIVEERLITETQIPMTGKQALFVRVQAVGKEGQVSPYSDYLEWQPKSNHWLTFVFFGLIALATL